MDENASIREALGSFLARYVEKYGPEAEFDPEWPSRCVAGEPDEGEMVRWQPVAMQVTPSFEDVEEMTGVAMHPDAAAFYGSWWAGEVGARHGDHVVLLNTVWNPEALDGFVGDLRDHLEGQEQAGLPRQTIPVAGTDSDLYFALDAKTGEIVLEEPGHPPLKVVAPSLVSFLAHLDL